MLDLLFLLLPFDDDDDDTEDLLLLPPLLLLLVIIEAPSFELRFGNDLGDLELRLGDFMDALEDLFVLGVLGDFKSVSNDVDLPVFGVLGDFISTTLVFLLFLGVSGTASASTSAMMMMKEWNGRNERKE